MEIKRKSQSISSQTPEERRNIPKKKHPGPQIPSSPKKKENKGINQRPFEIRNNNNDTYYQK